MGTIRSYTDLQVYQKAYQAALEVHRPIRRSELCFTEMAVTLFFLLSSSF